MASAGTTSSSSVQLLLLISTCFLLSISQETKNSVAAAADSPPHPPFYFSFDFTNQSSYSSTDLSLEGDAKVNGKLIDLTCDSFEQNSDSCRGRMSYSHPVPLHDDTTLASFSTSFTFKILVNKSSEYMPGDGMAFFLTGFPSGIPPNSSGEYLGLLSSDTAPYGPDQFVAVEFDTFQNSDNGDPSGNHIGIDINSVTSRNTTNLTIALSGNMTATIKFDNITRTLVASLELDSYPEPIVVTYQLPDLKTLLPREVAVGFSASTGVSAERHQILAWSFNSTRAPPKGMCSEHCLCITQFALIPSLLVFLTQSENIYLVFFFSVLLLLYVLHRISLAISYSIYYK
jgi:hypothetical protein